MKEFIVRNNYLKMFIMKDGWTTSIEDAQYMTSQEANQLLRSKPVGIRGYFEVLKYDTTKRSGHSGNRDSRVPL